MTVDSDTHAMLSAHSNKSLLVLSMRRDGVLMEISVYSESDLLRIKPDTCSLLHIIEMRRRLWSQECKTIWTRRSIESNITFLAYLFDVWFVYIRHECVFYISDVCSTYRSSLSRTCSNSNRCLLVWFDNLNIDIVNIFQMRLTDSASFTLTV